MMFSKSILTLCLLLSTTTAYSYDPSFLGGHKIVSCRYFSTHSSFFTYPMSRGLTAQISASIPERAVYNNDTTVKVSIVSAADLRRVKLESNETWQFCNDLTSFAEYCDFIRDLEQEQNLKGVKLESNDTWLIPNDDFSFNEYSNLITDSKSSPDPNAYASLDDMISHKANEFPVFQAELSPNADGLRILTYNISTSGVYCATVQFFGDSIPIVPFSDNIQIFPPAEMNHTALYIREQHAHGFLNLFRFDDFVLEFYSWLAQVSLIIVSGFYTFKKVFKRKSSAAGLSANSVYQKSLIQFKILIFLIGFSTHYLVNYLDLRYKNMYDSAFPKFRTDYIQSFITIVFSTWAFYNFLLLSSGVVLGYCVNSKAMLIVRIISVTLLIEQIANEVISRVLGLYHYRFMISRIIYLEELLVFFLGTNWARDIYIKLENRILKRKLATTYSLLCLVFFIYFDFAQLLVFWLGTLWVHDTYNKLENRVLKQTLATAYGILAFWFNPDVAILLINWLVRFRIRDSYMRLENKILKTTLAAVYILMLLVIFFHFALAETIMGGVYVVKTNQIYFIAVLSRLFTFIACALLVFIWRNVQFVNNIVQIDGPKEVKIV